MRFGGRNGTVRKRWSDVFGNVRKHNYFNFGGKKRYKKALEGFILDTDDKEDDEQGIAKINAILRFHYKINPDELSNDDWAKLFNEFVFVERQRNNNLEILIKNAVSEVALQLFGKK